MIADAARHLRFWSKVDRSSSDACWLWRRCLFPDGYGQTCIKGLDARAHRAAFQVSSGPIPDGLFVLHRCDVRACCNPSHLFLGTQRENMHDKAVKGRAAGAHHPGAKLTEAQVIEIRQRREAGLGLRALATMFGVSIPTVSLVCARKHWTRVA